MPDIPDHDEGGDPACWAHLFEDDEGAGAEDGERAEDQDERP